MRTERQPFGCLSSLIVNAISGAWQTLQLKQFSRRFDYVKIFLYLCNRNNIPRSTPIAE